MSQAIQDGDVESISDAKPFAQITKLIEPSRNGKPVHVATLGRWRDPGVRAKDGSMIRLRCVRFPSGWRTTIEWVNQFLDELTADRTDQGNPTPPSPLSQTPARRRREIERANRELAAIGI